MSTPISNLVGATILKVTGCKVGEYEMSIRTDRGTLRLWHQQDCCESVEIEDVTGDPADLIGGVVSVAETREGDAPEGLDPNRYIDSETWTFYEIRTTRGDLTLRWLGSSNGYYSEGVDEAWTANPAAKAVGAHPPAGLRDRGLLHVSVAHREHELTAAGRAALASGDAMTTPVDLDAVERDTTAARLMVSDLTVSPHPLVEGVVVRMPGKDYGLSLDDARHLRDELDAALARFDNPGVPRV